MTDDTAPERITAWPINRDGQCSVTTLGGPPEKAVEYIRADLADTDAAIGAALDMAAVMVGKSSGTAFSTNQTAVYVDTRPLKDAVRALRPGAIEAYRKLMRERNKWEARAEAAEAERDRLRLTPNDLYYLRAIDRRLREFAEALEGIDGLTIGGEAFADERDWLDCFIDRAALKEGGE